MEWKIKYHPLAEEELSKLDGSVRKIVLKGILKSICIGIRVVYKLFEDEKTHEMYILVVSVRADNEAYDLARKRK